MDGEVKAEVKAAFEAMRGRARHVEEFEGERFRVRITGWGRQTKAGDPGFVYEPDVAVYLRAGISVDFSLSIANARAFARALLAAADGAEAIPTTEVG